MIYFKITDKRDGKVVISNMADFVHRDKFTEEKNKKVADIEAISRAVEYKNFLVWVVSVGDSDLFKSKRRFKLVLNTYCSLTADFFDYFISKMNAHSHTITTIQGQMSTKLEGVISREQFRADTYTGSIEKLESLVLGKEREISEMLFYLNKRLFDMKNQIDGFNLLYATTDLNFSPKSYSSVDIKKVILNIATPFLDYFREKKVGFLIGSISDDYAQDNKIRLVYKLFNLALYNFFDNVAKYTKPNTDVEISFNKEGDNFFIDFKMISRYIEEYEREKIFEDSYSGKHSAGESGNGIGMFYTRKALDIMNFHIKVIEVEDRFSFGGESYSNNTFRIFN